MAERQRSAADAEDEARDTDIEDDARRSAAGDRPKRRSRDVKVAQRNADDGRAKRRRDDDGGAARTGRGLSAAQAGREGLRQVVTLIGKDPESVTGVEPSEDGWLVDVEVIEDRRIPSSTDILATYEVEIDDNGELLSYRRVRRYSRGAGSIGDD